MRVSELNRPGWRFLRLPFEASFASSRSAHTKGKSPSYDDDGDMEIINGDGRFAKRPFNREQLYLGKMRLSSDQVNAYFTRFDKPRLQQICDSIVGRSMLLGHDRRTAPTARFHAASIESEDGKSFASPRYYFPLNALTTPYADYIDSGVWHYVSVGFWFNYLQCDLCLGEYVSCFWCKGSEEDLCDHYLGDKYDDPDGGDDKVVCTATFRGVVEAMEGSIVYLGADEEAEIVNYLRATATQESLQQINALRGVRRCPTGL